MKYDEVHQRGGGINPTVMVSKMKIKMKKINELTEKKMQMKMKMKLNNENQI